MKTGDRVRLVADTEPDFLKQSGGGEGIIIKHRPEGWFDIRWDNKHENNYPEGVLELVSTAMLPEPEFTLAEINQGSELYTKLEGDHVRRS